MSEELKSAKLARDLELGAKMTADEKSGIISVTDDYYESTLPEGMTLDQLKKFQKHDSALLAATTHVGGEKATEMFRANPDLKEVTFKYSAGLSHFSGHFEREGDNPVRNVVEFYGASNRGELGKVHKAVKVMFEGINS